MRDPATEGVRGHPELGTAAAIDLLRQDVCRRLERLAREERRRQFHAGIRDGLLILAILISAWMLALAIAATG